MDLNAYLYKNPGIKNRKYKNNLKTKYGETKELKIPYTSNRIIQQVNKNPIKNGTQEKLTT